MRVDTTAPTDQVVAVAPRVLLARRRRPRRRVTRRLHASSEPAHGILLVDGRRRVFTRLSRSTGELEWNGKVDGAASRPGTHALAVAAEDAAGNLSDAAAGRRRAVRYVDARPDRVIRATRGHALRRPRLGRRAACDWRFGRPQRHGASPALLVLRAPAEARHATRWSSRSATHAARATVIVGGAVTATLAHAGGPVAAAGLALADARHAPRAASGRPRRLGGRLRRASPPTSRRTGTRGLRGRGRRRRARRGRDRRGSSRRWPWLLAVRGARLRAGADPGARRRDRREPARAAVRGRRRGGAGARLGARPRRRPPRELGPLALAARGCSIGWSGLSLAWTHDLPQGAIELLFFWLPFGLLAVSLARLAVEPARGSTSLYVAARRRWRRLRRRSASTSRRPATSSGTRR